jgi:glucose-6-phosphate isomerase
VKFHVDYIAAVNTQSMEDDAGQRAGLANMLAQAESLALGQSAANIAAGMMPAACRGSESGAHRLLPHKVHPGSRPSNIILLRKLNAFNLGAMLALYEHQVFVQAVIWGINPFDQWGVELGKVRAGEYSNAIAEGESSKLPPIAEYIFSWLK